MRLAALLLLFASHAVAQATAPPQNSDPSKEALVIEHYLCRNTFQEDGNGVREISAVVRVQAEAGVQALAVLRFQYSTESEAVEIEYVRVRKSDGSVVLTPTYNIQDMPGEVTRVAPMYSDIHEKHVAVKALGVGDTLEYLVRYRTLKPEIPGQFWMEYSFTKNAVIRDEQLQLTVPRAKYVKVKSPDLKPEVKDENSTRTYLWKWSNLVREDKSGEIPKRYAPSPSVQITTFHSWEEVGAWYAGLQKTQLVITPEIRAKAVDLTKGLTSDDDRIRALYEFVSTHVHYISLSFGIGRYQPHAADEVLGNEYGDCKDKHTLLATLLKAAGYDAWPALINSTRKLDPDVPSPAQFDHVITAVSRGNQILWLDTTPEVSPFRLLLANLRDKQALLVPEGKPASIQTTPANPPFYESLLVTAEGKLDSSGVLTAHMQRVVRGDAEVLLRSGFRRVPEAQWKDLVQRISYATGFGGEVSQITASAPEDTAKAFEYSYDYTRKDYSDWANHRIGPPMPPFGIEVAPDDEKKPTEPLFLGAPGELILRSKIELPSGAKPSMPPKVDISNDLAEYHATYKLEKNVWIAERRFIIKKPEVPLASWEEFRTFRKAVMEDENHLMDLNLPGETTASASPVAPGEDPELDHLFKYGYAAMQDRDLITAEENFRKIVARDPKFPNAHGNLGVIDAFHNQIDESIRELLKEEEIQPNEPHWFGILASLYLNLKREDDAIDQWQKLLKIDPMNRDAATSLGKVLIAKKRYPEAVQALETATTHSPDSPSLLATLGRAYIATKQFDKAESALKMAVQLDPSPLMLNNTAYAAADAEPLLDLSRLWSEKAVSQLEAATAKMSLSSLTVEDLQHVRSLIDFWDTLGWVYFRQGDFKSAEKYLRAAWILGQPADVGDHLAQAYEKQGKRAAAERTYELAYAAGNSNPTIAEHYKKLTGRDIASGMLVPKLVRGSRGNFPSPIAAVDELSRMRTVKAPTVTTKPASGEFFVLLSPGSAIEDVKFISGDQQLKSAASRLSAMKLRDEFPDAGPAHIVRRGILVCHSLGCDFTVLLPDNVRSLN